MATMKHARTAELASTVTDDSHNDNSLQLTSQTSRVQPVHHQKKTETNMSETRTNATYCTVLLLV
jgi:hypothetical protein